MHLSASNYSAKEDERVYANQGYFGEHSDLAPIALPSYREDEQGDKKGGALSERLLVVNLFGLLVDSGDFTAFEGQVVHQALVRKDETDNRVFYRLCIHIASGADGNQRYATIYACAFQPLLALKPLSASRVMNMMTCDFT